MHTQGDLVIYVIVGARLLLPLIIPRYPLFGVLACMVLDSADQSIMQSFGLDPPWYQGYDKALDTYYLSIAYLATMRNWENVAAVQVGRFLFYYRMIGVLAFELTGLRFLLAIFPNSFEPFFVYYELVRRLGNPLRLTRNLMLGVVAVIWFVIKLPQEWWIHIAQMDTTDFIKTKILGATLDTPFWKAVLNAPAVTGSLVVIAAIVALGMWRFVETRKRRAGPAAARTSPEREGGAGREQPLPQPAASAQVPGAGQAASLGRRRLRIAMMRGHLASNVRPTVLIEKIALVALVSLIFQQVLPGLEASGLRTSVFITIAIVATDTLLRFVVRFFGVPIKPWLDLTVTAALNFFFVVLFQLILPFMRPGRGAEAVLVFACLITLFVTLYDHYRPLYDVRSVTIPGLAEPAPVAVVGAEET